MSASGFPYGSLVGLPRTHSRGISLTVSGPMCGPVGSGVVLFLGRSGEQARFEAVLADLASREEPDEGHVLLVHGLGGIGKSTLLRRYEQIAADGLSAGWGHGGPGLLLAAVNWESVQRLRPADYVPEGGPPIWVVLDRVYGAIREAAAASRRDAAAVEKRFAPFRAQIAKVPELAKEVQRALAGVEREPQTSAADLEAVLQAVGRGAAVLGAAHPLSAVALAPAAIGAAHMASDARDAVRHRRQGPVPDEAYRLILRRIEELVDTFARSLRHVSAHARPVLVLLDTCELISGSQEYLRRAMRASGSRVMWVVGIRLEPEAVGRAFGEAALYRQAISESRLHSVPLGRFTDQTIGEYLERKLPGGLPSGVPLSRVAEVTRGIPLAMALVCDLLNAGQDPEVVLRPVPEPGRPSAVVRELADRYLTHACAALRCSMMCRCCTGWRCCTVTGSTRICWPRCGMSIPPMSPTSPRAWQHATISSFTTAVACTMTSATPSACISWTTRSAHSSGR